MIQGLTKCVPIRLRNLKQRACEQRRTDNLYKQLPLVAQDTKHDARESPSNEHCWRIRKLAYAHSINHFDLVPFPQAIIMAEMRD